MPVAARHKSLSVLLVNFSCSEVKLERVSPSILGQRADLNGIPARAAAPP
jgi:hypothetical protein